MSGPPPTKAPSPPAKSKVSYVGAPAIFALELACQALNQAFDETCYLVGSSLARSDWRDIDVRMIMDDESFGVLFPSARMDGGPAYWEFDSRWLIMTIAISGHLSKAAGLPIDFQFQPRTHANAAHKGPRHALGLRVKREGPS